MIKQSDKMKMIIKYINKISNQHFRPVPRVLAILKQRLEEGDYRLTEIFRGLKYIWGEWENNERLNMTV